MYGTLCIQSANAMSRAHSRYLLAPLLLQLEHGDPLSHRTFLCLQASHYTFLLAWCPASRCDIKMVSGDILLAQPPDPNLAATWYRHKRRRLNTTLRSGTSTLIIRLRLPNASRRDREVLNAASRGRTAPKDVLEDARGRDKSCYPCQDMMALRISGSL